MKIEKIISEWGRKALSRNTRFDNQSFTRPPKGFKRVMAIVSVGGEMFTRHVDVAI